MESNPEPVEEHPLHDFTIRKKERQLDQIRRAFMFIGYEIAELPLDDVRIAKLQKEVGKILKRVKTIKDEIPLLIMLTSEEDLIGGSEVEAASTGDPDGSSDVESTQATWGPEAKRRDSGSSETWKSNPEAREEISPHELKVRAQELFDEIRKEVKKIKDEMDQALLESEDSINVTFGGSDLESTQATSSGSEDEYDGKLFHAVDGMLDCLNNADDHCSAVHAIIVFIAAELDKIPEEEPSLLNSIEVRRRRLSKVSKRFNPDGFQRLSDISERFHDNADRLLDIVDRFYYSDEARPRKRRKGTQPTQGLPAQTRNRYRRFMRSSRC